MKTMFVVFLLLCACRQKEPATEGSWIKGTEEETIKIIEKQLRGMDMAMVETDYRYQELYWAGQDMNWEYADYQLIKIRLAIENGLQRRPKRAQSALHFLNVVLPEMQKAGETRDSVIFNSNFQMMTAHCNACHAQEKVPFFKVKTPTERQSTIRK